MVAHGQRLGDRHVEAQRLLAVDPAAVRAKIQAVAAEQGLTITALRPAAPELEDVFVAVLEENAR